LPHSICPLDFFMTGLAPFFRAGVLSSLLLCPRESSRALRLPDSGCTVEEPAEPVGDAEAAAAATLRRAVADRGSMLAAGAINCRVAG